MKGSCHCGAVAFECTSRQPYPYNRCYCSICRKTTAGGGYTINLASDLPSTLTGAENLSFYHPVLYGDDGADTGKRSLGERAFCKLCGSQLWNWDCRWPELLHPTAGAIDTPLPKPPVFSHMMTRFAPDWAKDGEGAVFKAHEGDNVFDKYPNVNLMGAHEAFAKAASGAGGAGGDEA
mmetsp:Transcript_18008/g.42202  ORF Transcript_18008/g.42202 Transcript_18008/m.42202 type:complete len:178 (+) Transcript_18008:318-851(+)